jgi:hypothetical protein
MSRRPRSAGRSIEQLAAAGVVGRDDARRWSDGLRAADADGSFFSSYTGFLVRGTARKHETLS